MRLLAALLLFAGLLPLGAQNPVFRIRVQISGSCSSSGSYSSTLEIAYAPCSMWVGGSGGWIGTPAQHLEQAGGLAAIRPGMGLPFYAHTYTGSASGGDGSHATVVTVAPGMARWTETVPSDHGSHTSVREPDLSRVPSQTQAARFVRTATGARISDFDLGHVSAGAGGYIGCASPYAMDGMGDRVVALSTFDLTNEELAHWKQVHKQKSDTFSQDGSTVTITAILTADLDDPGEVDVTVDDYESWMPKGNLDNEHQPGNSVKVKAVVRATALEDPTADRTAEISFELTDVSREPGVCLNWPVKASDNGKGDLRLRREENPSLKEEVPDLKLTSQGLVKKATLVVSCFDYAAWGVLKVSAKDKNGKPLRVTYHGKALSAVTLPRDEDRNHIPDAWQQAKGVMGYSANWDEAEVAGQQAKGDGLSLFQKYRGLVVMSAGGRRHVQLEPKEKVHFVIDPDGLLEVTRFQASTGLRVYKVLESWTRNRKVDIHADFSHAGGKYASLIRKDLSIVDEPHVPADPTGKKTHDQMVDDLRVQWGASEGPLGAPWRPSNVDGIVVYSGRIHDKLCRIRDRMVLELSHPERQEYAEGMAWWDSLGMGAEDRANALKQLQALTDQEVWSLVKPIETWLAIHELSHGVGVNGHLENGKESEDCSNRVPTCPMQYLTWQEKRRYLLYGEVGGTGALCRQDPHHCWKLVNPKG